MYIAERWLALAATCFIALCLFLFWMAIAQAHDHNHPELTDWYKSLYSRGGAWCCNGDDASTVEEYESAGDHYRAKVNGVWIDIPNDALVDGPNRAGQAKIWLKYQNGNPQARCFIAGAGI